MATHPMPPGSWSDIEINPLLSEDTFQNEHSRGLFDAIDRLRSCGASQDIALPELVIVGDQSAGKSSLLQSLTDIPFPVASNVCTRFPTRIISRRTPGRRETTTVSIEPSPSDSDHKIEAWESGRARYNMFDAFKRSFSTMTKADFIKVIDDAAEAMGIGESTGNEANTTSQAQREEINFSDNILKVEISGPDRSHFSILDVPGIFHSLTRRLTKKDKEGVDKMVKGYMKSKQSIIICVANGMNDLGPQAIFEMVDNLNNDGWRTRERTVGVITKCDATQRVEHVIETVENIEKPLCHGWFVVRNRTPSEVDQGVGPLERFQKERDFFNESRWNSIPEERRGTQALKKYLAELLCTRIEQEFPTFLKAIQTNRDCTASSLQDLGVGRRTIEQKRAYLTRIAHDFNSLATQGLRGRYDGLTGNDMKLRMKIRDANDRFVQEMNTDGHYLPFLEQIASENTRKTPQFFPSSGFGGSAGPDSNNTSIFATYQPPNGGIGFGGHGVFPRPDKAQSSSSTPEKTSSLFGNPILGTSFGTVSSADQPKKAQPLFPTSNGASNNRLDSGIFGRKSPLGTNDHSGETAVLSSSTKSPLPPFGKNITFNEPTYIYDWIRNEIKASRGTELQGTMNPDVLPILFHKQARKWRSISESHFENVTILTFKVVCDVLKSECKDPHTSAIIESLIEKANKHSRDRFLALLSQRMDDVLSRHLQTNNPAFEQKVTEARKKRFHAALERYKKAKNLLVTPANQGWPPNVNSSTSPADENQLVIDMRDTGLLFAELHMSNSQNLEDEIHDTLKAYYEITKDDFVEYVNQLIVEPYLNDTEGPVLFFSPVYVASLKDEDIEVLAAEDEKTVLKRKTLGETLARLNQAEAIVREYDG
ncbi:hypothetical protein ABVK25_005660 [Lepraria finkii]|uniref:GED domain-containing protein n=1 Tax=Lepraria finkii TaxID=1340010 RepID=A0ABR4BBB0_9LECA